MKKLILSAAAICVFAATTVSAQATNALVRIVHASPNAPAVDIYVDSTKVLAGLPYKEYSDYLPLPAGSYTFKINVAGTDTQVLSLPATVSAGGAYTVIAKGLVGGTPAFGVTVLQDDLTLPANNQVKVRVVHAAAGAPAVDVYWTTPFAAIDNATPVLTNVPFDAASGYLTVPVASYQARVTVAGTKTVAIDSHRLVTWANMIRTVVAVDAVGGGAPFSLIVLGDRN